MNKLALTMFLAALIALSGAQTINSFRNLSSGGALDADLEFALDPIDLQSLDGVRFYGGLSNFSAEDRLFSAQSSNRLMMGISTDKAILRKLKVSLLAQYAKTDVPQPFTYNISPYSSSLSTEMGEMEILWESYSDNNSNGLFDEYVGLRQKFKNVDSTEDTDIFLVMSRSLGAKSTIGYKFGYMNRNFQTSSANSNFLFVGEGDPSAEYILETSSLPQMDSEVQYYWSRFSLIGEYNTESSNSSFSNQLAFNREFGAWDLSAYYRFEKQKQNDITADNASKSSEFEAFAVAERVEQEYGTHDYEENTDSMGNFLSFRMRHNFQPNPDLSKAGFISFGLGAGLTYTNTEHNLRSSQVRQDNYDYEFKSSIYTSAGEDDGDIRLLSANMSMSLPLNNVTFLGTGIIFAYSHRESEGTITNQYSYVDTLYNLDGSWASYFTQRNGYSGEIRKENTITQIRVPFGFEYWFTNNKKWAFRAGTTFTQSREINKLSEKPTSNDPLTSVVTFPDGSEYVTSDANTTDSSVVTHKTSSSHTDLSYGICFSPSKNLQIELISMFEDTDTDIWSTSFLHNLRLAFTFRL